MKTTKKSKTSKPVALAGRRGPKRKEIPMTTKHTPEKAAVSAPAPEAHVKAGMTDAAMAANANATRAQVCAEILSKIEAPDSTPLTVGSFKALVAEVAAKGE